MTDVFYKTISREGNPCQDAEFLPFEPEDADRIIISNAIFLFLSLDLKRMNCEVPI